MTNRRKHPDAICEECPLAEKPCAPSSWPTNGAKPTTAVVSRSPGYHEAMVGKPFSGPSGKVLDYLLQEQGVERNEILVTNTVLCAPDAGEVPTAAIKACAPRLEQELSDIPLVIAAGSEAVNLLVGRGSIGRYRGYRIERPGRTLVATNNPALVMRDDSTFPNLRKDFRRAFNPLPQPVLPEVEVIEDGDTARDFLGSLRDVELVACDIESRGGLTHRATLVTIQFATEGSHATVLGERGGLFDDRDFIENHLQPLLEKCETRFIWHNGKFDVKILRHGYGIDARVDEDTMLQSYILDERGGVHALEYLLMEEFGWPNYEPESVKKFKEDGTVRNYEELHNYSGWDAAGTYQLYELFTERIPKDGVGEAYGRLLLDGSEETTKVELAGFKYNIDKAADLYDFELGPEMENLTEEMRQQLDNPLFNPKSNPQVQRIYYDVWKVKHDMQHRPDKKRSADEAALKEIDAGRFVSRSSDDRELIQQFTKTLMRYRKVQKQASTYIVGLIERAVDDPDGRIYTDLLLHGTTSGRLSSRNPNLQNITREAEDLPSIRGLFEASPGRLIVQADFSQAELRCIAYFSQDPILLDIYNNDKDLHSMTAERFYGPKFTKANRDNSKNMNFGMFYRQTAATFQEKHDIPEGEAQKYIDWAKITFPSVWEWEKGIEEEIRAKGVLVSPFGRKRRFHLLTPENKFAVFREGINFFPQSTASDFTLRSLILLSREIDWGKAALVLTVHDSIIGDVSEGYVEEYSKLCREVMESRPKDEIGWTIPFKVDISTGATWGDCK